MRTARHHPVTLFFVSIGCAFLFALVYVLILPSALPTTDGAYGRPPFADPMVVPVMSTFAVICGVLVFPGVWFVCRKRKLRHCLPVLIGLVLLEILTVTFINTALGFLGSLVTFGAGLIVCYWLIPEWVPPGHCASCGYSLRGTPDIEKCPECGATLKQKAETQKA